MHLLNYTLSNTMPSFDVLELAFGIGKGPVTPETKTTMSLILKMLEST